MIQTAEPERDDWRQLQDSESTEEFFQAWLNCLVSRLRGSRHAVLIWAETSNVGPFHPAAVWPPAAQTSAEIAVMCERALALRLPVNQSAGGTGKLAFPVMAGGDLHGVVALESTVRLDDEAMSWLRWGIGWLLEHAVRSQSAGVGQAEGSFGLILSLLTRVMEANSAVEAAQGALTEAAQRLGCERVSLGFGDIRGIRLFAISHSAEFTRRLDLARLLESVMDECADQGVMACLGLPQDPQHSAVMMREHQRLQRDHDAQAILSVPFKAGDTVGVFVFEWLIAPEDMSASRTAAALVPILGRALAERRLVSRPWPLRFRDWLKQEWEKLIGPRRGARKLIFGCCVLLLGYLTFATGELKIAAPSKIEGGVRRVIVAPFDGFVGVSQFRAGQEVESGQVLAILDDRDLRLEASRWESQRSQYQRQAQDAHAQQNLAQIQISLAQSRQAEAQRELSTAMLERSRITAPFSGVIVSGDLTQKLGAAVKKGEVLYEIAPLDFYRVILEVDEADIAHVEAGQRGELILAAMPAKTFPLTVSLVTPVASAKEGKNSFRVEAVLDRQEDKLRPGMEGVAKVYAGEHSRVWIWTRRFFDWLRLKAWVWMGI